MDVRLPKFAVVVAVLAATVVGPSPASSQEEDPAALLMSSNVELVTTLPSPGVIGARFHKGHMFVTSVAGLLVYDVTDPAAPSLVGSFALPHFENEDVDLNGDILLISNDAAESTGILYVIDISDPAAPTLLSFLDMGGNPVLGGPGHTASCIKGCSFAWVTDAAGIKVVDLRDPENPVDLGTFETPAGGGIATHDVQVDGNGYAWVVGFGGAAAYKIPKNYAGTGLGILAAQTSEEGLSTYLDELGLGDGSKPNDYILHNSLRKKGSKVVYITEEDYTRPGCRGAGEFQTWRVGTNKNGLPVGQVTILDQWATELSAGGVASPAAVCSAHYFDLRKNLVAQGWYEQGIRFLDVSAPQEIRQIGYFIPPTSMTWAAYFAPTDPTGEIVYSFDATHGIDVLRITRPAKGKLSVPHQACAPNCKRFKPRERSAPVRPEWVAAPTFGTEDPRFGYACRLGVSPIPDGGIELPDLDVGLPLPSLPDLPG
jgi:hypothetical protein